MLNELVLIFNSNVQSSETYYNATQSLHEFLTSIDLIKTFPQVSENLGDSLPNLRKASHQLFQAFIRTNGTFDPIISAMLSRGLVHHNWVVRQKNINSLQSLLLSDGKLLNCKSHLLRPLTEMILNKLYDQNNIVIKATEQTLITLIQIPNFRSFFSMQNIDLQNQVDSFVDSMKQQNQLNRDFQLRAQEALPFNQQDLEDLNDTQWQMRAEAINNISNQIQGPLTQPQVESLFNKIVPLLQDHNFNIVITGLNIILKCVQYLKTQCKHMKELQNKLSDPKSAVRSLLKQILLAYLTKIHDHELLILIVDDIQYKNVNQKEEVLDLCVDLLTRNRLLLQSNFELVLKSIAPLVEDPKTKLRMKSIETLVSLSVINPDLARRILGNNLNKVFMEMYLERAGQPSQVGPQNLDFSTTNSSTRSDMTSLASRLKNKGESLQQQQDSYVPSSLQRNSNKKSDQKNEIQYPQTSMMEVRQVIQGTLPLSSQEPERTKIKQLSKKIDDEVENNNKATFTKPFQKKSKFEADKTFQPTYLEELLGVENPESAVKSILNELRYDEWSHQFEALNTLRRLTKNHSDLLRKSVTFQGVLQEVVKCIENLRSGVAKNALIALQELSETYRKDLDIVMENALQKLIKKAIDSNQFIAEEVRKVTIALFLNCSEARAISLAAQTYQSKSGPVKVNLGCAFNQMLQKKLEQQNFEKLVQFLCCYVCDQAQEVRQIGKDGLSTLDLDKRELEQLIRKVAPEQEAKRILAIMDRGYDNTGIEFRKLGATFDRSKTPDARTPLGKTPADFELMPQHFMTGESAKDWKQRLESIDWLFALARKHSKILSSHKYANKFLDFMVKAMNDANSKVALHSCENMIGLVVNLKIAIQNNATNVWNGVFQTMASNNNQVRQSGEQLFLELGTNLDIQYSLPQITHLIIFGPLKSKGQAISMLSEFVTTFYEEKPQLVLKHLIPLAKKLQDEQKPELKQASLKFFQQLIMTCPDDVAYMKLMK